MVIESPTGTKTGRAFPFLIIWGMLPARYVKTQLRIRLRFG